MKRNLFNTKLYKTASLFGVVLIISFSSCTDLEVEQTDSILSAGFQGVDPVSTFDGMYNNLNDYIGSQANLFALSEVTTDALVVPTRGGDWGDNGIWRQLHQHAWTPEHEYIINVWNEWNSLQLSASQVLSPLSNPSTAQIGEASFLRALGMYVILDNFGQVPFRDITLSNLIAPEVLTGSAAVDFIISDLNTAISNLPSVAPAGANDRASVAAARYLLAKVLLNKHIYTGSGSVDAADMNEVISLVDAIAGEGYSLENNYFDVFKQDADNETILYFGTSVGTRIWNGLHYNQNAPGNDGGGWNGFATLAEYYDLFEGDPNSNVLGSGQEERRGWVTDNSNADASNLGIGYGFLLGLQYNEDATPLEDRNGNPLVFERNFVDGNGDSNLQGNSEVTGIRVIKYHPVNGQDTQHMIFLRYADAHLMKAEAILRGGTSGQTALDLVNELRSMRNGNGNTMPLASLSEQDLLDERARELYIEFWRRNDLIRFGQYNKDWELKNPDSVGDTKFNLFPIPANQLPLNPNLVQNPGY